MSESGGAAAAASSAEGEPDETALHQRFLQLQYETDGLKQTKEYLEQVRIRPRPRP